MVNKEPVTQGFFLKAIYFLGNKKNHIFLGMLIKETHSAQLSGHVIWAQRDRYLFRNSILFIIIFIYINSIVDNK